MSKNKNKSKKVPNGTIVRTRDEFFKGDENYRKPNYRGKGNYRKTVVVDSNKKNELAVVKITSSEKSLQTKKGNKYRPFILTKDDKNKGIKEGKKFLIKRRKDGSIKESIDPKEANEIKNKSINDKKQGRTNRKKLKKLKNRK